MNTELVEAALAAAGRCLVVLDEGEVTDDLLRSTARPSPFTVDPVLGDLAHMRGSLGAT
jgi:hypothetical protein